MAERREDFITRDRVHNDLHDWWDAVMERDALALEPPVTEEAATAMLKAIHLHVVNQVKVARERLFNSVPPGRRPALAKRFGTRICST
jgi:hypothetical protein